ncbi:MAG: hypothetical protein WDW36_000750 [Sanguina aurantia]
MGAFALGHDADRYQRKQIVGRGSFGSVFTGFDTVKQQEVAIKVIDLEDVQDDIEDIHKEITALAGCRCSNITDFYGAVLAPGSSELLIIMELMSASVADMVHHCGLEERSLAFILQQVLQALSYLHAQRRIHRDVKSDNILLSIDGEVKLSDFGVSGQMTGTLGYRRKTFVGTPFWMAPEVIESSDEGYSEKADIWSLGITAIEMATGSPPHAGVHPMRVLFMIPKEPAPRLEGEFRTKFKDFVACCLKKDPRERPSAKELLSHDFIASAYKPSTLGPLVGRFVRERPPVESKLEAMAQVSGTLPSWDFGSKKAARPLASAEGVPPGPELAETRIHQTDGRSSAGSKVGSAASRLGSTHTHNVSTPSPSPTTIIPSTVRSTTFALGPTPPTHTTLPTHSTFATLPHSRTAQAAAASATPSPAPSTAFNASHTMSGRLPSHSEPPASQPRVTSAGQTLAWGSTLPSGSTRPSLNHTNSCGSILNNNQQQQPQERERAERQRRRDQQLLRHRSSRPQLEILQLDTTGFVIVSHPSAAAAAAAAAALPPALPPPPQPKQPRLSSPASLGETEPPASAPKGFVRHSSSGGVPTATAVPSAMLSAEGGGAARVRARGEFVRRPVGAGAAAGLAWECEQGDEELGEADGGRLSSASEGGVLKGMLAGRKGDSVRYVASLGASSSVGVQPPARCSTPDDTHYHLPTAAPPPRSSSSSNVNPYARHDTVHVAIAQRRATYDSPEDERSAGSQGPSPSADPPLTSHPLPHASSSTNLRTGSPQPSSLSRRHVSEGGRDPSRDPGLQGQPPTPPAGRAPAASASHPSQHASALPAPSSRYNLAAAVAAAIAATASSGSPPPHGPHGDTPAPGAGLRGVSHRALSSSGALPGSGSGSGPGGGGGGGQTLLGTPPRSPSMLGTSSTGGTSCRRLQVDVGSPNAASPAATTPTPGAATAAPTAAAAAAALLVGGPSPHSHSVATLQNAQTLITTLQSSLGQLERLLPGCTCDRLQGILLHRTSPSPSQVDASGGGGGSSSCSSADSFAPGALRAGVAGRPAPHPIAVERRAHNQPRQRRPGAGTSAELLSVRRAGFAPELGPLGSWLLGKWQEEVSRQTPGS